MKTLLAKCDIRNDPWREFITTLRGCNPRLSLRLHWNDLSSANRYLQQHLLVREVEIEQLCRQVAWHYGLHWSEVDVAWAKQQDRTVAELHRRLWHIANQTSGERIDYERK